MSAVELYEPDEVRVIERMPVARLRDARWIRQHGLDASHVAALTELDGEWAPILVWGPDDVVIDGAHRVAAARRLGLASIAVTRFHGSVEDAFVEAVRVNSSHGLPLTMRDRSLAAARIVADHPEWSDRRIAAVCAVAAKTIARIRTEQVDQAALPRLDSRVGRDGKLRPTDAAAVRARIIEALEANPDGSLRAVAAVAGASPETVRSVRRGLTEPRITTGTTPPVDLDLVGIGGSPEAVRVAWSEDSALAALDEGEFAAWFASTDVVAEDARHFAEVPVSRIYVLADEARRRSAWWAGAALELEERIRRARR